MVIAFLMVFAPDLEPTLRTNLRRGLASLGRLASVLANGSFDSHLTLSFRFFVLSFVVWLLRYDELVFELLRVLL